MVYEYCVWFLETKNIKLQTGTWMNPGYRICHWVSIPRLKSHWSWFWYKVHILAEQNLSRDDIHVRIALFHPKFPTTLPNKVCSRCHIIYARWRFSFDDGPVIICCLCLSLLYGDKLFISWVTLSNGCSFPRPVWSFRSLVPKAKIGYFHFFYRAVLISCPRGAS